MKKLALFTIILFTSLAAQAQFPSEIWHDGKMVLIHGDTLRGFVKYDLETDLIQFSNDKSKIKTYTARKVIFFEIFDGTSNRYRRFFVLPYELRNEYKAPIFFELIYEGKKLTLLSREAIEYQVSNYPYSISGSYTRLELVYTHYFLTDEGKILKFEGKKKDLLRGVMSRKSSEIKKFIKANRIKVERRTDLVSLVIYYNSLFENNK